MKMIGRDSPLSIFPKPCRTGPRADLTASDPAHQKQYDEDDDDDADDTDAAVTVAVTVPAEPATEAAEQEDDQDDDKDEPDRHDPCSVVWRLFAFERVLETANRVLNLALDLVGLAVRLELGIADRLAGDLLDGAFDFLRRSGDPILVHGDVLQSEQPSPNGVRYDVVSGRPCWEKHR